MSLTARLHIEGHEKEQRGIKVLSCDYSFSQDVENNGLISSSVRAGFINVSIPGINDAEIVQWMVSRNIRKKGKISFLGVNESGVPQESKSIEFEDAILVNYSEAFIDESDMVIHLSISARKITLSNTKWETQWDTDESRV
ncbi:hypothetical protein D1164_09270 [Mariniphaga sediminis]|jgi:hypothetical protein|uniref:Type VI secretion system needle protein Hcp n=1 Tax=Mariniphaga sediminis TaxID=1628158 RepID=A0A399D3L3_9BACT|nr:type VI secretion system tube protein TssD [Mariniphaga sediminis]RIH65311.1 hypothetical protein D1164_09270 [Mariniphaga sediminis]